MKRQKDTSTSLSASPSLRSGQARHRTTNQILSKLDSIETLLKKKDDKPMTFKEACTYLGYAPSYLYKLTYRKVIPHYKPTGKMIFFSKSELDEWIFESRCKAKGVRNEDGGAVAHIPSGDCRTPLSRGDIIIDPNQIEMELEEDPSTNPSLHSGHGSAQEIVIEFPRKSRRKTLRQVQGDKK